jgi:hypothetical protein
MPQRVPVALHDHGRSESYERSAIDATESPIPVDLNGSFAIRVYQKATDQSGSAASGAVRPRMPQVGTEPISSSDTTPHSDLCPSATRDHVTDAGFGDGRGFMAEQPERSRKCRSAAQATIAISMVRVLRVRPQPK